MRKLKLNLIEILLKFFWDVVSISVEEKPVKAWHNILHKSKFKGFLIN